MSVETFSNPVALMIDKQDNPEELKAEAGGGIDTNIIKNPTSN